MTTYKSLKYIVFFLLSLTFTSLIHADVQNDYRKLKDCSINFNLVPRATYNLSDFHKIVEDRAGLQNFANISFNCSHNGTLEDDDISPVKIRFIAKANLLGETPVGDFTTIHDAFRVSGAADINGDSKLYVKLDGSSTVISNINVDLSIDNQVYTRVDEGDIESRITEVHGDDILDGGGLLPEDTYIYKVCLFGKYQSDDFDADSLKDVALACDEDSMVYVNPFIKEIFLYEVNAYPNLPVSFMWEGIDENQIRSGVDFYYKLLLWEKEEGQDKEDATLNKTYCPALDELEIKTPFFEYPKDIPECNDLPIEQGDFVWKIELYDEEGRAIGDNISSELGEFTVIAGNELTIKEPPIGSSFPYTNQLFFSWSDVNADNYSLYITNDEEEISNTETLTPVRDGIDSYDVILEEDEVREFIKPNTPMYWIVKGFDSEGNPTLSDIGTFIMETNVADAGYDSEVLTSLPELQWDSIQGAEKYFIYLSEDAESLLVENDELPDSSLIIAETSETRLLINSFEANDFLIMPFKTYFFTIIPVDDNDRPWGRDFPINSFLIEAEFQQVQIDISQNTPPYGATLSWQYFDTLQPDEKSKITYKVLLSVDGAIDEAIELEGDAPETRLSIDEDRFSFLPNQSYQFIIQPLYNGNEWGDSFITEDLAFEPPQPAELSIEFKGNIPPNPQLNINFGEWKPEEYIIRVRNLETEETLDSEVFSSGKSTLTYSDLNFSDLDFDKEYEFFLIPRENDVELIESGSPQLVLVPPLLPIIPDWENAQFLITDKIELKWNEIKGVSNYLVKLSSDPEFETILLETNTKEKQYVIDPSLLTKDTEEEKTYFWSIQALNNDERPIGDIVFGSFLITQSTSQALESELKSPENEEEIDSFDFSFSWTKVKDAKNYTIQISESRSFDSPLFQEKLSNIEKEASEISNLLMGETYFWRVLVDDNKASSDIFSFTIENFGPNLEAPNIEDNTIELEWNSLGQGLRYEIEVSRENDFARTLYKESVSNTTHKFDADFDGVFFIRVTAYREGKLYGQSSNILDAFIQEEEKQPAPTLISPVDLTIDPTTAKLTWKGNDSEKYSILIGTDSNLETSQTFTSSKPELNLDSKVLNFSETYFWRVSDENNQSSSIKSFKTATEKLASIKLDKPDIQNNEVTFKWKIDSKDTETLKTILLISKTSNIPDLIKTDNIPESLIVKEDVSSGYVLKDVLNYETSYYVKVIAQNGNGKTIAVSPTTGFSIGKYRVTQSDIKAFQSKIESILEEKGLSIPDNFELKSIKIDGEDVSMDLNQILQKIKPENIRVRDL